jgi:hypothetical protein
LSCRMTTVARRSEKYDRALAATRVVVNKHDPIRLIEMGARDDEYDPEVADLVRLVLSEDPIDDAAVDAVWVRWFGEGYAMSGTAGLQALTADLRSLQVDFGAG